MSVLPARKWRAAHKSRAPRGKQAVVQRNRIWLVANARGMKWLQKVHSSHVTSLGTTQTPRTPPHSLWQVRVARTTRWSLPLSSRSHPEPSFPRTAAFPLRLRNAAPHAAQAIILFSRTSRAPPPCRRCRPGRVWLRGLPCGRLIDPAPPSSCCSAFIDDLE